MNRIFVLAALFAALVSARVVTARAADPEELPKPAAVDDAAAAPAAKDAAQDSTEPAAPAGEKWRFRRHQGLWWYWLPSEKWVYWTGSEWKVYDQESYAQFNRSTPSRRAYSYSDRGYYGRWGPVTYDSYGQPQYPYSRRTRGIKQLGPVPAMGGVRSLPGWGGER
jgi:hypothetical protein